MDRQDLPGRSPPARGAPPLPLAPIPETTAVSPGTRGYTRCSSDRPTSTRGLARHRGPHPTIIEWLEERHRPPRHTGLHPYHTGDNRIPYRSSPRTRGYTLRFCNSGYCPLGLPRHTGLHRLRGLLGARPLGSPPAHGAAPSASFNNLAGNTVSPGTRGCTEVMSGIKGFPKGLPRHTGLHLADSQLA